MLLVCIGVLLGRSAGGPSKRAVRSDDGTDPTHIGTLSKFEQSTQEYIPPGADMDTFNIAPSKGGNMDESDESQEESTDDREDDADEEGGFGFSYGDEDARENDAVVEYEDEEDEDINFRGSRRASANNVAEDDGQFEGAFEPDGDVYDDGQEYDDEGDDGDYEEEYEEEGEVYDDEEGYEDEEYDEEAEGQDHPDGPYEDEYEEGDEEDEGEVYQEDGNVSYDEESYYTEEVEEEGSKWDNSFQVNRTNSL